MGYEKGWDKFLGGRGLKPFVVSTCNCLNAVSSRGVPRLIAGTWRVFQGRATWPLALFLVLFSYALLFGTFGLGLCGPSYPGLFWVRYGQCCWSIDTFELVIKGENIPLSSTQCLLLDPVPADCDLFRDVGRAPGGGADGEAMSPESRLTALKSCNRIVADVVAMSKATCLSVLTLKICVF